MSNKLKSMKSMYGAISLIAALVLLFVGAVMMGLFNWGLAQTNKMEFCISCHSMQVNYEEYKETVHYKNVSGVQATCADCHVPKEFFPKLLAKVIAAKDVYHEIIGTIDTEEKYEAHRWNMATRVWAKMKANDSRECRTCHEFSNMDMDEQDRSARNKHSRAVDEGKTCIDCHTGIAHDEPVEPDEPEPEEGQA
jgi:cytochrome c-type protein NapC